VVVALVVAVVGSIIVIVFALGDPVPRRREFDRLCAVNPGVELREWTHIILHHSATEAGGAATFDRYHRGLGWDRGLGYNFVIGNGTRTGDGEIEVGDRWRRQTRGAHCKAGDMNARAVGICFVGNFETDEGPSEAQLRAGADLVRYLAWRFAIPCGNILGHGEVTGARTQCPGRFFPIERMRAAAREAR